MAEVLHVRGRRRRRATVCACRLVSKALYSTIQSLYLAEGTARAEERQQAARRSRSRVAEEEWPGSHCRKAEVVVAGHIRRCTVVEAAHRMVCATVLAQAQLARPVKDVRILLRRGILLRWRVLLRWGIAAAVASSLVVVMISLPGEERHVAGTGSYMAESGTPSAPTSMVSIWTGWVEGRNIYLYHVQG